MISKRILVEQVAMMHRKGKFFKIKEAICNVLIESASIHYILPRPADSNGRIVVKVKQDLKRRSHVYFEPVRLFTIYQTLNYLKSYNKFYEGITISKGLRNEMLRFFEIEPVEENFETMPQLVP